MSNILCLDWSPFPQEEIESMTVKHAFSVSYYFGLYEFLSLGLFSVSSYHPGCHEFSQQLRTVLTLPWEVAKQETRCTRRRQQPCHADGPLHFQKEWALRGSKCPGEGGGWLCESLLSPAIVAATEAIGNVTSDLLLFRNSAPYLCSSPFVFCSVHQDEVLLNE